MKKIIARMQCLGVNPNKKNNIARIALANIANRLAPREYHGEICFSMSASNATKENIRHNLSIVERYLRMAGFRDVKLVETGYGIIRYNIYMRIE